MKEIKGLSPVEVQKICAVFTKNREHADMFITQLVNDDGSKFNTMRKTKTSIEILMKNGTKYLWVNPTAMNNYRGQKFDIVYVDLSTCTLSNIEPIILASSKTNNNDGTQYIRNHDIKDGYACIKLED